MVEGQIVCKMETELLGLHSTAMRVSSVSCRDWHWHLNISESMIPVPV
jgi:hypothetical protein